MAQSVTNLPAMQETWVRSLGWEDPLEKEMATHSSILAWRIPWTEEPGGLQSMGSQRVGNDRVTFTFTDRRDLGRLQGAGVEGEAWRGGGSVHRARAGPGGGHTCGRRLPLLPAVLTLFTSSRAFHLVSTVTTSTNHLTLFSKRLSKCLKTSLRLP